MANIRRAQTMSSDSSRAATRALLSCGSAAGLVYVAVGIAQILTREGFDMRRHALSLLSNGDLGWIQIANFLCSGLLVIAGAAGVRRALHPGRGGTWLPILFAIYGLGLIGAGIFVADPGAGFPPGTPSSTTMTRSGVLHFVFGGIGFYAIIAACFVATHRFSKEGRPGWAIYSAVSGAFFFISFAAIASGTTSVAVLLTFYAAVAWIWAWLSALMIEIRKEVST
jgi:Protein of unknown function (DUF998)